MVLFSPCCPFMHREQEWILFHQRPRDGFVVSRDQRRELYRRRPGGSIAVTAKPRQPVQVPRVVVSASPCHARPEALGRQPVWKAFSVLRSLDAREFLSAWRHASFSHDDLLFVALSLWYMEMESLDFFFIFSPSLVCTDQVTWPLFFKHSFFGVIWWKF